MLENAPTGRGTALFTATAHETNPDTNIVCFHPEAEGVAIYDCWVCLVLEGCFAFVEAFG